MHHQQLSKQPKGIVSSLMKWVLGLWFRVQVTGVTQTGSKSLIIANRTSSLDALLLALFLPIRLTIAVPKSINSPWMIKVLGFCADVVFLDPANADTTRDISRIISSGVPCLIFPEGFGASREEQLQLYQTCALVLQETQADIIPIRIGGPEYSIFSISKKKHILKLFPKATIDVRPTEHFAGTNKLEMSREELGVSLFKIVSDLNFVNHFHNKSLFPALIEGSKLGSKNHSIIEDANRTPLTYKQFRARCFILGLQIKRQTKENEVVGVLMPTTNAGMITFFALHAYRRIPAMLNFSMGAYNIVGSCKTGNVHTIYTSKQFIETAKLESLVEELVKAGLTIHYLEQFKSTVHLGNKLAGLVKGMFPAVAYKLIGKSVKPQQTALILFTSGSEGLPKAVALSHENILANCYQMIARVDFDATDKFFNSLPIFHCFGLTAGSVLPLVAGLNCFFYPSPLHYKIIPGLVGNIKATIMFGTDTFLNAYARAAEKTDFRSVRYIFAGAEKVKPETSRYWQEVLGVTIFEGYGATEASPVISMNCFLGSIPGTVGMILSQMEYRITPVEGITEGGRLCLRGPNVMQGYIRTDESGTIEPLPGGWHDTGDIVTINNNGFITIIGRAKRFAKIGGEMVSLTAVEGIAASIWPEVLHAAIIKKTANKGERIVLFTEAKSADLPSFIKKVKEIRQSELFIPYEIFAGNPVPVLASGKIDYVRLESDVNKVSESVV